MNVITTLAVGDYLRWGERLTLPKIRAYADKYGWDFVLVDQLKRQGHGYSDYVWDMLERQYELLGKYDRLFNIPIDCIIKPDARDVLDYMPAGTYYGFDEYPFATDKVGLTWSYARDVWSAEFGSVEGNPTYLYNTGPMLVDKSLRELFAPVRNEIDHGMMEMAVVNMRLYKYRMSHKDVRPEFFNASNIWIEGQPVPDFLHVMWFDGQKEQGVESFLPRMGWTE